MIRYPGSKRRVADRLVARLAPALVHVGGVLVEPFFGSGAVTLRALEMGLAKRAFLAEKDVGVLSLWRTVKHDPAWLKRRIRGFHPTVAAYGHWLERSDWMNPRDMGFRKLVLHQLSYSGLGERAGSPIGGWGQEGRWKIDCRWKPNRLCAEVDRLHPLLRRIELYSDWTQVLVADENSVAYVDPPYYQRGPQLYKHGEMDHAALARTLRNMSSPWLLSYDDCPEVRALYAGCTIENMEYSYTLSSKRRTQELLISRGL